eukprot:CAMPEP_0197069560 /NCGR_PEP_ID=MMETSP1384-20130603/193982_1 /TAXON_ID=29189 /ORGANISM="Ammonia sp." /LENGTH=253 /DNA_ID=CAMNT_0042507653 /DNA_START=148 /DNA_END=906 /DNA_ORIENTATION=+
MSIFNLDEQKLPKENVSKPMMASNLASSRNYDEDTKRWLSNTELHPINRFHEVSLWGNPQFNFYSYAHCNVNNKKLDEQKQEDDDEEAAEVQEHEHEEDEETTEEIPDIDEYHAQQPGATLSETENKPSASDPYSFLDIKLIENATPIKLHDESPTLGPRQNQPQIQVQISDLQGTIDSAMDTVIDEHNVMDRDDGRHGVMRRNSKQRAQHNANDDDEDVEFDRQIPIPPQNIQNKSLSIGSNESAHHHSRDN